MYNANKIETVKDAIAYIEKVLTWSEWRLHHRQLVRALEILLAKVESESKING